jgi:hypothetical protein
MAAICSLYGSQMKIFSRRTCFRRHAADDLQNIATTAPAFFEVPRMTLAERKRPIGSSTATVSVALHACSKPTVSHNVGRPRLRRARGGPRCGHADTIGQGRGSQRWIPPACIRACASAAADSGSSRQSATTQNVHYGAARGHHPDSGTAAHSGGSARILLDLPYHSA